MNVFHRLLISALLVAVTTNFVWFALTYFVYIETRSVISTGVIGGIYLVIVALTGLWFGTFIDRNKKKYAMFASSVATLIFFISGFLIYQFAPFGFGDKSLLWIFATTFFAE